MNKKFRICIWALPCLVILLGTAHGAQSNNDKKSHPPIVSEDDKKALSDFICLAAYKIRLHLFEPIYTPVKSIMNTCWEVTKSVGSTGANVVNTLLPKDVEKERVHRAKIVSLEEELKKEKKQFAKLERELKYYAPGNDIAKLEQLMIDRHDLTSKQEEAASKLANAKKSLATVVAAVAAIEPYRRPVWKSGIVMGSALVGGISVGYTIHEFIVNSLLTEQYEQIEKLQKQLKKLKKQSKKIETTTPEFKALLRKITVIEHQLYVKKIKNGIVHYAISPAIALAGAAASAMGLNKLGNSIFVPTAPAQQTVSEEEKKQLYTQLNAEKTRVNDYQKNAQDLSKKLRNCKYIPTDLKDTYNQYLALKKSIKNTEANLTEMKTHISGLLRSGIDVLEQVIPNIIQS